MNRPSKGIALVALAGVLSLTLVGGVLVGCGGGSSGSSSSATSAGRATLRITWPDSTARLIPGATNSIVVTFKDGAGTTVSTKTIARPTSGSTTTTSFTGLPVGTLTLTATAYPTTTGTGTAQATASQSVEIVSGATATPTITMVSTISSLTLAPTAPSVVAGNTLQLVATPVDASGATVLVGSTLTYASSNAAVATIGASGLITGVAAGTTTLTVTETESGKTATVAATVTAASSNTVVDLAKAYIDSLSTTQQGYTVVAANSTNAAKWINLPATPNGNGTQNQRNGVSYSTLTSAQKTAWNNLVNAVLAGQPLTQYNAIRASDNYLGTLNNGYSGDYQYLAFVGTPSTSGTWTMQVGGHHIAHNYTFVGNTLQTTTPYFLGVEPTSFTYSGTAYTPMAAQKNAVTALLQSFSTAQLSAAKLSSSFSDVYLGPGKDARSNFPTGTSGRGALVSGLSLSTAQQTLLKNAIAAWTNDSPLASTYQSLYESELSSTYVGYAGNASAPSTAFTSNGDYLRIDGPHVWIEFVCQNGVVISGQIHYHTIWRDRVTDYNAAYGF